MNTDRRTQRQRSALTAAALLSVLTGQLPALAGRGALPGLGLAVGAAALLGWLWGRVSARRAPGRGLRILSAALLLPAGAMLLREGADRLVTAVYPESPEWLFAGGLLAAGLVMGAGRRRTLGRAAELAAPVLALVLLLALGMSLPTVDLRELWPLRRPDAGRVLPALGRAVGCVCLALPMFWPEEGESALSPGAMAAAALPALGLSLAVTGALGEALAREMDAPLFVLIRNLRPGPLPERAEALAAGVWVVSDVLALAAILQTARLALGGRKELTTPLCAAAVALGAWGCASTSFALETAVRTLLPALGGVQAALLLLFSRKK